MLCVTGWVLWKLSPPLETWRIQVWCLFYLLFLFNSAICPCGVLTNSNNKWDYFRLNPAEVLIAAAVLDLIPLLEQINKASGILVSVFFYIQIRKVDVGWYSCRISHSIYSLPQCHFNSPDLCNIVLRDLEPLNISLHSNIISSLH